MKNFDLKRFLLLYSLLCIVHLNYAQEVRGISGQVTDATTGEPLPGVNVMIIGTTTGTVTDLDGNFSLQVSEGVRIRFSYIGYSTKELTTGGQNTYNIQLELDSQNLGEVLVIGYGEQSRETLTSSVSKMDQRVLENIPFANAASAMQGTVSGVRVQTTTGQKQKLLDTRLL